MQNLFFIDDAPEADQIVLEVLIDVSAIFCAELEKFMEFVEAESIPDASLDTTFTARTIAGLEFVHRIVVAGFIEVGIGAPVSTVLLGNVLNHMADFAKDVIRHQRLDPRLFHRSLILLRDCQAYISTFVREQHHANA